MDISATVDFLALRGSSYKNLSTFFILMRLVLPSISSVFSTFPDNLDVFWF
jgi:hypothetical protein